MAIAGQPIGAIELESLANQRLEPTALLEAVQCRGSIRSREVEGAMRWPTAQATDKSLVRLRIVARLIPSAIDPSTARSERDVLDVLKRDLPDDLMILHGQRVAVPAVRGGRLEEVEVDIVVIDPRRGVLCIEVKGGEVVRVAAG